MIYIGSSAMSYWFSDVREPKDIDILVEKKEDIDIKKLEQLHNKKVEVFEIPPLYEYIKENLFSKPEYLWPNLLYTLKVSHLFWDINWDKHMFDVVYLKKQNCILLKDLFYKLYEYWKLVHKDNKRTDFNKSNDEFFKDKVSRKYNHDDLHKLVAYGDSPIFQTIKKNLDNAEIDEELFEKLDLNTKFKVVREEVYVIALERWLIPGETSLTKIAYSRAIKALITRLSPLWLALFIIENYSQLRLQDKEFNFYQKFLENGNTNGNTRSTSN